MAKSAISDFSWSVPNVLTISRLIAVPVFAFLLLSHPYDQEWRIATTIVFIVAIATDSFDGWYARKYDLVSNWGKIWDSVADKSLTGMAFLGLSIIGELPWVITVLILVREWGITAMRFAILKYGVMSANRGGKLKTVLQSLAIPLFLIGWWDGPEWFFWLKWILMGAAFVLTIVTGLDYLLEAYRLRKASLLAGGPVDISKVRK